jgi:peptidoglycan/xylan/chitin deacetylase (PgdA/CDA1 family)
MRKALVSHGRSSGMRCYNCAESFDPWDFYCEIRECFCGCLLPARARVPEVPTRPAGPSVSDRDRRWYCQKAASMIQRAAQRLRLLANRWIRGTAPIILMYHRVADISIDPWGLAVHPGRFEEQIDSLTRTRRVVHLHELLKAEERRSSRDKPLAVVTFDDGYHDVYANARGILGRYDCPMTLFVTTGAIGATREFWWDAISRIFLETELLPPTITFATAGKTCHWPVPTFDQRSGREKIFYRIWADLRTMPHDAQMRHVEELGRWAGCSLTARESHRAMTREEVRNISDDLVVIGAHTVTHPTLPAHLYDTQYYEIAESRRVCEELVGAPVSAFAYPFGDHDDTTVSAVRRAGFALACTADAGVARPGIDPVRLPRIYIGNWNGDEFQKRLAADPFL